MTYRLISITVAALALCLATPLIADSLPTTQPGSHAAKISGTPGRDVQDLFGVRFVGIDGRNIQPREVMWLEPGTYELTVVIDAAFTRPPGPGIRRSQIQRDANTIEVEVEAGKTYEIRGQYDRDKPADEAYSVIVWRVKD